MKKILISLLTFGLLFSCGKKEDKPVEGTEGAPKAANKKLVVGASPTPHQQILEQIKDDLAKEGVDLEIVTFNDYVLPNKQLADGGLDANFFQHVPYMEKFAAENNMDLVAVAKVHVEPIAFYSKKIKNISELSEKAEILIPNDPTNRGRALILLDKNGIIKLKDNTKLDADIADIVENPKKVVITAMNPEQIAPRLSEVAGAVINGNFALNNGLTVANDAILVEDKDSPYVNVITVLKGKENDERIQKLVKAINSEKVRKFIEEKYKGEVVPAF